MHCQASSKKKIRPEEFFFSSLFLKKEKKSLHDPKLKEMVQLPNPTDEHPMGAIVYHINMIWSSSRIQEIRDHPYTVGKKIKIYLIKRRKRSSQIVWLRFHQDNFGHVIQSYVNVGIQIRLHLYIGEDQGYHADILLRIPEPFLLQS